jgi:hypothetical protein
MDGGISHRTSWYVSAHTDLHIPDREDMCGCVHWNLPHWSAYCLPFFLTLALQVLMHAARNFALQEHAIENTESVSIPHTVQYDCRMNWVVLHSAFVGIQDYTCLKGRSLQVKYNK